MADKPATLLSIFKSIFSSAFGIREPEGIGIPSGEIAIRTLGQSSVGGTDYQDVQLANYSAVNPKDLPLRETGEVFGTGVDIFSRRQRYAQYELLEDIISEVDATLNTYADEASSYDVNHHVCAVKCKDKKIREEAEFVLFKLIQIDRHLWGYVRNGCQYGDEFLELIIDPVRPELGILGVQELDAATMWRIQSKRGKLLEFQQSLVGPDYDVVIKDIINKDKQTTAENIFWRNRSQTSKTIIRFAPAQILHLRIGGKKRGFYPYGISILASARRAALNLKLMEDAMMVYRITRATERRVYYIDVGSLQGPMVKNFVQAFMDNVKRKKSYNDRSGSVDENWNPMNQDDDLFLPIRPNSATKVETLPGACLSLDTLIPLIDGRTLSLSEIISEFQSGKQLWAYSCHPETGEIAPGEIYWAGITRQNTDVVLISLSNGNTVTCTPDHKFPVVGEGFVEARNLAKDDKFFPFGNSDQVVSVCSVVPLAAKIDTGTLTIDADEEIHNYHTFALAAGVFTKNSNLSDVDDVLYFRRKFYISVKIPPGFLEQTIESQTNRLTLSSTDMKFAKVVLRVQKEFNAGFTDLLHRHFELQRIPRSRYDDLEVVLTPSSDWQEMAKAEVVRDRMERAQSVKSMDIVDDKYILTEYYKMGEEEADEHIRLRRKQEIDKAETQAQVAMVTARGQAEIDRANAVNQARSQQSVEAISGGATPPPEGTPPEEPTPPTEETPALPPPPTEEEVGAALPSEEEISRAAEEVPVAPERPFLTPADEEAEREEPNV